MTCYVITGPTACGKSELAMQVAKSCGGEIICMDSMQIYRHMDIGTAKPTAQEQAEVAHHMLDIIDPWESFSVAAYSRMAEACAAQIIDRGHVPVFVGGTGFYLRALRHPMAMGGTAASPEIRAELEKQAEESNGPQLLHDQLEQVDPVTAQRLHPNDVRRVIRALEVYAVTGKPFSEQSRMEEEKPRFDYRVVCLNRNRAMLYERIELRVDHMMKMGLEDEVESLLKMGVSPAAQAMQAIGYKEIIPLVNKECSYEEAVSLLKLNTRHYAKRQLTWMRREEDVLWLEAGQPDLLTKTMEYLNRKDIEE